MDLHLHLSRRGLGRLAVLSALTTIALIVLAGAANAGIYHVKICPTAGTSAPGWTTTAPVESISRPH